MFKKNKIKFAIPDFDYAEKPTPAKQQVPDWYKNADRFFGNDGKIKVTEGQGNHGLKLCTPFLDAMTAGYTANLWVDILVEQTPLGPKLGWRSGPDPADRREKKNKTIPTPAGHHDIHFTWKDIMHTQTPPGYSCLITHPLNRHDLPFTTLSGIVDTDMTMARGNLPFFLKEGFEGVISAGTPMFQIIPFKRENWQMEEDNSIMKIGFENEFLTKKSVYGWYKNNKWHRKSYE